MTRLFKESTFPVDFTPPLTGTKNMAGKRFGELLVLGFAGRSSCGHLLWLCQCSCRQMLCVQGHRLRQGRVKSCMEAGEERRKEHSIFVNARSRCRHPKNPRYDSYGGRGIEFRFDSFHDFFKCLGFRPSAKYSIDRIDNDGHYEPGNVRWATSDTQNRNKRHTRYITINGERKGLSDWIDQLGVVSAKAARARIGMGWCGECAVSLPTKTNGGRVGPTCPHRTNPQGCLGIEVTEEKNESSN